MRRRALLLGMALVGLGPRAWAQSPCPPTRRDSEGPFYKPDAPRRESTGKGLIVSGSVKSAGPCDPIKAARVEWWQAGLDGRYDDAHRGSQATGEAGTYRFETDFPAQYGGRPIHIHFKAFAPGLRTLTTQLYLKPGQSQVTFDLVLVKE